MSADNPIRFSHLKWMAKSPAHYKWFMDHPPEPSKSMRLGAAVDAVLYGTKPVLVSQCASRRGKAWDEFVASNKNNLVGYPAGNPDTDSILLVPSEMDLVAGMADSLRANSQAFELLMGNSVACRQRRIEWEIAGRLCSGTPDVYSACMLADLKTCRSAHPDWFQYDARKLAYHAQLDWYGNGLEACGKGRPMRSFLVAVENTPPHVVTIFEATERALLEGRKPWTLWFERLRVCEDSGVWPGYVQGAVPFDTPEADTISLSIEGEDVEV